MPQYALALIVGLAGFLAGQVPGEGRVGWEKNYPRAGQKPGEIVIKGSTTPHNGYALASARLEYNLNGGVVNEAVVPLQMNGSFEETVTGLTPGAVYYLKVTIVERRAGEERTLALVAPIMASR